MDTKNIPQKQIQITFITDNSLEIKIPPGVSADSIALAAFHLNRVANGMIDNAALENMRAAQMLQGLKNVRS